MNLATIDIVIFVVYLSLIIFIGLWVSRNKGKTSQDYFLASKSLPWWAIGASLIAANISAEQFIGMSGSGFALGLAIASYEWMGGITLLIVGKFFLPVFIKQNLYTIPEFIEKRYSSNLKTILAIFWISLFILVNLTSVLYLGARAMDTVIGTGDGSLLLPFIIGLALFAATYSIWGGLSAVAWTDVLQVVLLVAGGIATTVIALTTFAPDNSVVTGFQLLLKQVPERFSMILSQGEVITPNGKDAWVDLPGLAVLIGGLWVANLYYFGFNQYIIQRTFAAKSLAESQKGIVFAAFLKLFIPFIVVIPGIIAYAMNLGPDGNLGSMATENGFISQDGFVNNDNAAPWLIKTLIPSGLKGLVLAALAAAIVSSLASMLNSTATIFTMDIYKVFFNRSASEQHSVNVGRATVAVALIIAVLIAPLLRNLGQAFQFIQEYTGVVSPGILAVFLSGLFMKRATNNAAIWGVISSIPVAFYFKVAPKGWSEAGIFLDWPFMHQMMATCLITLCIIFVISTIEGKGKEDPRAIQTSGSLFQTSPTFNIGATVVLILAAILYAIFW
jgi:SSS family solute:Na+ symporter